MSLSANESCLQSVGAFPGNPRWEQMTARQSAIYTRENDVRSEFYRDYTRILHCTAYRRLKHKTQVFFAPQNDHICTRIEHVSHVESIGYTISKFLGLNTELTQAIAVGHDLGHAPFGHMGEDILNRISEAELGVRFWHEKNGLHFVDDIELLEDDHRGRQNLDLTYAVRDGILSHCGEVDENGLIPRGDAIDLSTVAEPGRPAPYTWEGCVVKMADKIAYLGRDIEDAYTLNLLDNLQISALRELIQIIRKNTRHKNIRAHHLKDINNTVLINDFVSDICAGSGVGRGIRLSEEKFEVMKKIKAFNNRYIYHHKRIEAYREYADLIIRKIYTTLKPCYGGGRTGENLANLGKYYPVLADGFLNWLEVYWDLPPAGGRGERRNKTVYPVSVSERDFRRSILDYISGMTDQYAIRLFHEIVTF